MLASRRMPSARDDESRRRGCSGSCSGASRVGSARSGVRPRVGRRLPVVPGPSGGAGLPAGSTSGATSRRAATSTELARDEFAALYRDNEWLLGISLASEACALLGDVAGRGHAVLSSSSRSPGGTPSAMRRAASARSTAISACSRRRSAGSMTRSATWRPRSRSTRGWAHGRGRPTASTTWRASCGGGTRPGIGSAPAALDRAALATAGASGWRSRRRSIAGGSDRRRAGLGRTASAVGTFRREGEYWTVEFGADTFRVRDAKGMRHLARLLASPGREVHALELARSSAPSRRGRRSTRPMAGDAGRTSRADPRRRGQGRLPGAAARTPSGTRPGRGLERSRARRAAPGGDPTP